MNPVPSKLPARRLPVLVIVLAAWLCAVLAQPAHAVTKPYSLTFSAASVPEGVSIPSQMPAGMTIAGFTVTLRNDTDTQKMGSAEVTVPPRYVVASAPKSSEGSVQGPDTDRKLALRDLEVAPGETVTIAFDLQLPCVRGPSAWVVVAKQSNDFNGTGNLLTPPPDSTLVTEVSGRCALRFGAGSQPAGAGKNDPIRAEAYKPGSPDLVAVEAVDGRPDALAQPMKWFTGDIRVALTVASVPDKLVPSPSVVPAVAGVARFPAISITAAGTYNLRASTGDTDFVADDRATSRPFKIVDEVSECKVGAACSAELAPSALPSTRITGAAGDDSGVLLLSSKTGNPPSCTGYRPPVAGSWFEFELLTAEREKTIVVNYTKAQMRTVKGGAALLEVCFAAPGPGFPAKYGTQPFDYDGNGTAEGFVGLLTNCPPIRTSPCVTRRGPLSGGGAFIEFFAPASLGDPRYH